VIGSESKSSGESYRHLLHNLVLFGRVLRGLGLDVNPGRMIDLVKALSYVNVGVRSDFYHAARSLLVHSREDVDLFDQAFEMFWQRPIGDWQKVGLGGRTIRRRPPRPVVRATSAAETRDDEASTSESEEERTVLEVTRTYSSREVLTQRDFSDLSEDEVAAVKDLISELVFRLGERTSRRRRSGRGTALDLRRTVRRSLRHGGEILDWSRREPRLKPRPLVVLADVSGSMERYTRLLLHFLYALSQGLGRRQRVEAFAFGTRLTRLSRHLADRDVERALSGASRAVTDWAGGTRIGSCLKRFNFDWARRVLAGGAIVLLISDGWDRGDPALLAEEMARLKRSCYRLIWLNPLLGAPDYEPLTRGMLAALPHVDDFMPVHNLSSLEELAKHLERIQ
jgi:uncharacterized protein with von Willebrand factor type A (vWA) domain